MYRTNVYAVAKEQILKGFSNIRDLTKADCSEYRQEFRKARDFDLERAVHAAVLDAAAFHLPRRIPARAPLS